MNNEYANVSTAIGAWAATEMRLAMANPSAMNCEYPGGFDGVSFEQHLLYGGRLADLIDECVHADSFDVPVSLVYYEERPTYFDTGGCDSENSLQGWVQVQQIEGLGHGIEGNDLPAAVGRWLAGEFEAARRTPWLMSPADVGTADGQEFTGALFAAHIDGMLSDLLDCCVHAAGDVYAIGTPYKLFVVNYTPNREYMPCLQGRAYIE